MLQIEDDFSKFVVSMDDVNINFVEFSTLKPGIIGNAGMGYNQLEQNYFPMKKYRFAKERLTNLLTSLFNTLKKFV